MLWALALALESAGKNNAERVAMMAMTTNNLIGVNHQDQDYRTGSSGGWNCVLRSSS
jgi:hypothetical protein